MHLAARIHHIDFREHWQYSLIPSVTAFTVQFEQTAQIFKFSNDIRIGFPTPMGIFKLVRSRQRRPFSWRCSWHMAPEFGVN